VIDNYWTDILVNPLTNYFNTFILDGPLFNLSNLSDNINLSIFINVSWFLKSLLYNIKHIKYEIRSLSCVDVNYDKKFI
jgi:hypothetical protein